MGPCSSFSHLLSSAVRKDREPGEAGGGEGVIDVNADVTGLWTSDWLSSAEDPCEMYEEEEEEQDEEEQEEEEEEKEEEEQEEESTEEGIGRGASSQLPRGKVVKDVAASYPTLSDCSPAAADRRLRFDLWEELCSPALEGPA